jgi:hypothetical protein
MEKTMNQSDIIKTSIDDALKFKKETPEEGEARISALTEEEKANLPYGIHVPSSLFEGLFITANPYGPPQISVELNRNGKVFRAVIDEKAFYSREHTVQFVNDWTVGLKELFEIQEPKEIL